MSAYVELVRRADPPKEKRVDKNGRVRAYLTLQARILKRIQVDPNGCWIWQGWIAPEGYANVSIQGKNHRAHRVTFELLVGPIPEGLELDHLCRVRSCCNPEHLEPVTRSVNTLRGLAPELARQRARALVRCAQGHPFDGANTRMDKHGHHICRKCDVAKSQRYPARKRAVG